MGIPTTKERRGALSTPQEIASAFLPGSTRYVRVITMHGLFFFRVSVFPAFGMAEDGEALPLESPGTRGHEELCERLADMGRIKPARFILEPPIPFSFVEDGELTLYQVLADAQKAGSIERVFCEAFEDELLAQTHFDLSLGEECEKLRPCMITLAVKGVCFETVFMLTERNGMQYALCPGEAMQDEDAEEFNLVFSLV